ncbi:TlpA disulfide reductase family protein [Candidatus Albibeggiatoa sp. nov. NOAA]|uniref:TlpA family protein disulfide reductase n=1 Tax=Candidatus Albibeggiatoa sp. nov. NOAA TaxID=3162724 RepID=UPI0032F7F46B|nr:TlpA family protein disulfide reductase [Thiotrichaceae bacterium]
MKMLHFAIIFAMLTVTLIVTNVMLAQQSRELNVKVDSQQLAPSFSLPDLQGVTRHSSEWSGKIVIVNFWASWCPPCIREIPGFIRLQDKYAEQVQFVGIALDQKAPVEAFVERMQMNYPTLQTERKGVSLSKEFGNRRGGLPFTAIVNTDGTVVTRHLGELPEAKLDAVIQQLIAAK